MAEPLRKLDLTQTDVPNEPQPEWWQSQARQQVIPSKDDYGVENALAALQQRYVELAEQASGSLEPDAVQGWWSYLDRILTESTGARCVIVESARKLWKILQIVIDDELPPPSAGFSDEGFHLGWDRERHHFEFELSDSGKFGWFYRDRSCERVEGREDLDLWCLSPELIRWLSLTIGGSKAHGNSSEG